MSPDRFVVPVSNLPYSQELAAVGFELHEMVKKNGNKVVAVYKLHIPGEVERVDLEIDYGEIKNLIADMYFTSDPEAFLNNAEKIHNHIKPKRVKIVGALPEYYNTRKIHYNSETNGNFTTLLQREESGKQDGVYAKRLDDEIEKLEALEKLAMFVYQSKVLEYLGGKIAETCDKYGDEINRVLFKYKSLGQKIMKEILEEKKDLLLNLVDVEELTHQYNIVKGRIEEKLDELKRDMIKLNGEKNDCINQMHNIQRSKEIAKAAAKRTKHKEVDAAIQANLAGLHDELRNIEIREGETHKLVEKVEGQINKMTSEISSLEEEKKAIKSSIEELEKNGMQKINDLEQNLARTIDETLGHLEYLHNLWRRIEHAGDDVIETLERTIDLKSSLLEGIKSPCYYTIYLAEIDTGTGEKLHYIIGNRRLEHPKLSKKIKKLILDYTKPWKGNGAFIDELAKEHLKEGVQPEKPLKNILPEVVDAMDQDLWWIGACKRREIKERLHNTPQMNSWDCWCF